MKKVTAYFIDGAEMSGTIEEKELDKLKYCFYNIDLKEEDRFVVLKNTIFRASQIHHICVEEVE